MAFEDVRRAPNTDAESVFRVGDKAPNRTLHFEAETNCLLGKKFASTEAVGRVPIRILLLHL
jgi:hypothetical protein